MVSQLYSFLTQQQWRFSTQVRPASEGAGGLHFGASQHHSCLPPLHFLQYQETLFFWSPDSSAFLVLLDDMPVLLRFVAQRGTVDIVESRHAMHDETLQSDSDSILSAAFSPLHRSLPPSLGLQEANVA